MARALLDSNVLVHAASRGSPLFTAAARLVQRGLSQRGLFCIAPQNLVEFAAVVTRSRFVDPPLAPADASRIGRMMYASRRLGKIYPTRGAVQRAMQEGSRLGLMGPVWYDLFLAVTMREAGVAEIVTENVDDFRKFDFLTVHRIQDAG